MAITRVAAPTSTPVDVATSYQAQNNCIASALSPGRDIIPFSGTAMTIGYRFQLGGTEYLVETATSISGSASPYVKITPSGDGSTCSAAFVADLTGVSWNSSYSGFYDIDGNLYLRTPGIIVSAGDYVVVGSRGSVFQSYDVSTTSTSSASLIKLPFYGSIRVYYSCLFTILSLTGVGSVSILKNGSAVVTKTANYNGYQDINVIPGDTIGLSVTRTSGDNVNGSLFCVSISESIPFFTPFYN